MAKDVVNPFNRFRKYYHYITRMNQQTHINTLPTLSPHYIMIPNHDVKIIISKPTSNFLILFTKTMVEKKPRKAFSLIPTCEGRLT